MPFVTTTEGGAPIQGPTATLLYDDWYPALRTATLRPNKLAKAMLLDIPLVLGRRTDGRIFAMRDSCPHRGIPLSYGSVLTAAMSPANTTAGSSNPVAASAP